MQQSEKIAELQELKERVAALESELAPSESGATTWVPKDYYTTYHVLAGMVLGVIGAASSLLFNVIGAAMLDKHPLELIRVYLTFPMGAPALEFESGFALAAGCCLYLATGMIGGIPFHLILSKYFARSSMSVRFIVATVLGIGVWLINFYGILSWLQPLLINGNWIVERIPVVVAVLTHLVFAWTLLLVDHWGRFVPPAAATKESSR